MRKHTHTVRENHTHVVNPMLHRNIVSIEFLFIFLCPTAAFKVRRGREDTAFPIAAQECIVFYGRNFAPQFKRGGAGG